ncbi:MAG: hypothetical protein Q8K02_11000 [Flavobacterium sp.]|nr:hypothetical protein [Flavobacterium sp.]
MHKPLKNYLALIIFMVFLASCGDLTQKMDKKLEDIGNKTDSLVNAELDGILSVDSMLQKGNEKVKKMDSLMQDSGNRLDSLFQN